MTNLIPLHFENADVRTVIIDGEPWWVGLDATALLEITRGRQALAALEDYEKGAYIIGTLGGPQETTIINESGIYSLILRSGKPIARKFKRWLTCEVLPSLRRHGSYPAPPEIDRTSAVPDPRKKPRELETQGERLFAEFKRVLGTDDVRELTPILTHIISKSRLVTMQRDLGVMAALKHGDAWTHLIGMGIDLRYVLNDYWTFTPEEREYIDAVRMRQLEKEPNCLLPGES